MQLSFPIHARQSLPCVILHGLICTSGSWISSVDIASFSSSSKIVRIMIANKLLLIKQKNATPLVL